jgi:hypothetical protein
VTGTGLLPAAASFETVGPGFAGFLAIFAVAVATVFLLRSMVGHLRKVRYSPDPAAEPPQQQQGPPETSEKTPGGDV